MRLILITIFFACVYTSRATRWKTANLITCFLCTGPACQQPFNLSEGGISSSLCMDGCVMQQIMTIVDNKKQLVTTIRGCITSEGCETTVHNSIIYENSCCYYNLCNSFFTTTTKSTSPATSVLPRNSTKSREFFKLKFLNNTSFRFKWSFQLTLFLVLFSLIFYC